MIHISDAEESTYCEGVCSIHVYYNFTVIEWHIIGNYVCVCMNVVYVIVSYKKPHEAMFSTEIGGFHFPKTPTPPSEYVTSGEPCSHGCEQGRGANRQHVGKNK